MNSVATGIFVHGLGAVSPAGWGLPALLAAVAAGQPLPTKLIARPGSGQPLPAAQVPAANPRPPWLAHARLRRTSPITQYMVAAALEAIGSDAALVTAGSLRLGIVVTVMSGCVNYSRRFYDEALRDPATASPLVFPETVFNAPASHLAALLGSNAINYTLVGDPGTFLQGIALAADWLARDMVDACVVVGAEEVDWLTSHAFRLFDRRIVLSDGAGAVYLRREPSAKENSAALAVISDPQLFTATQPRLAAARAMRAQLTPCATGAVLVDGLQNLPRYDRAEVRAWDDWTGPRVSPKNVLAEGLMAAAGWQTVLAVHAVEQGAPAGIVSIVGTNQQAIGAVFMPARA